MAQPDEGRLGKTILLQQLDGQCQRRGIDSEQGKGNFNVKAMNAAYLAGCLRREDEKLETGSLQPLLF